MPPGGQDAGLAACDRAEGLDRFERLGVPFEAARTREHLAALEPATAARSLLEGALSTYERLDCTPHQQAVQARLIELT